MYDRCQIAMVGVGEMDKLNQRDSGVRCLLFRNDDMGNI